MAKPPLLPKCRGCVAQGNQETQVQSNQLREHELCMERWKRTSQQRKAHRGRGPEAGADSTIADRDETQSLVTPNSLAKENCCNGWRSDNTEATMGQPGEGAEHYTPDRRPGWPNEKAGTGARLSTHGPGMTSARAIETANTSSRDHPGRTADPSHPGCTENVCTPPGKVPRNWMEDLTRTAQAVETSSRKIGRGAKTTPKVPGPRQSRKASTMAPITSRGAPSGQQLSQVPPIRPDTTSPPWTVTAPTAGGRTYQRMTATPQPPEKIARGKAGALAPPPVREWPTPAQPRRAVGHCEALSYEHVKHLCTCNTRQARHGHIEASQDPALTGNNHAEHHDKLENATETRNEAHNTETHRRVTEHLTLVRQQGTALNKYGPQPRAKSANANGPRASE